MLFLCGEHYHCHPYLIRPDGTNLHKLADRRGHRGVHFLDVPDFHDGCALPFWSVDGKWVYFTAKVDSCLELFRVPLKGQTQQLTRSPKGALNYHPHPSPDGKWLIFGSNRSGLRQLYLSRPDGSDVRQLTQVGFGAMWPHWQPAVLPKGS